VDDTLETASTIFMSPGSGKIITKHIVDMLRKWNLLTIVENALNRSMEMADGYQLVLSETSIRMIRFVHELICPS